MELVPQNDIADFLNGLADHLGTGPIVDFIRSIARFFDSLTAEQAQALQTSGCWQNAIAGLQQDLMENLANAVSDALVRLQEALACMLGGNVVQGAVDRDMARAHVQASLNLGCLWQAATVYFQTRNALQAAMAYFACATGGGGGTGSGGFTSKDTKRCG